jgi:hypothetical protein
MEKCPSCSNSCIPARRRMFSQSERFKCPTCATWLQFLKGRPTGERVTWWTRHSIVIPAVLGLAMPIAAAGFGLAAALMECHWGRHALGATLCALLGVGLSFEIRAEWRRKMRATLVIAQRQDAWPALDGARELVVLARTPAGRRFYCSLLTLLLAFGVATTGTTMLAKRLQLSHKLLCSSHH